MLFFLIELSDPHIAKYPHKYAMNLVFDQTIRKNNQYQLIDPEKLVLN